ncbi:MAG: AIPR family protein [Gemmatimonadaceae bacterium]|nr:AIPR family protein [Gemmatimonadaceae bacterium]
MIRAFKALDDGSRKKWVIMAYARDLPPNLPLDANARIPNVLKNPTCIEQRETLLTHPEDFPIFNGGVVCTATEIESKQDGNQHYVEVVFDQESGQGLVNGGHTYAQLLHVVQDNTTYADNKNLKTVLLQDARHGSEEISRIALDDQLLEERVARAREKAMVQIEFVAPVVDSELLAQIARARNLSQSVEATALQNLAGKFDLMKSVLSSAPTPFGPAFRDRVIWKTNQEIPEDAVGGAIPVKLLIQVLALINARLYPPATRVANDVYSRAGVVVREFGEAEGDDEKYNNALTKILPEIIRLYDHIYATMPEVDPTYPWADGKFDTEKKKKAGPSLTPLTGRPCGSKVANAFVWPIFSAFRSLLVQDDEGEVKFKVDPISLFNDMKNEMITVVQTFHRHQAHGVVHQVGKDKEVWLRLQDKVELELKLRERERQAAKKK